MKDAKTFVAVGIAIAVLIGIGAVFFSSDAPDGLESTALVVSGEKTLTGEATPEAETAAAPEGGFVYQSPFPDYTIGPFSGPAGGIIAIVTGTILAFAGVLGISRLLARKRTNDQ